MLSTSCTLTDPVTQSNPETGVHVIPQSPTVREALQKRLQALVKQQAETEDQLAQIEKLGLSEVSMELLQNIAFG